MADMITTWTLQRKFFMATEILLFDFKLFIGGQCEKRKGQLFEADILSNVLVVLLFSEMFICRLCVVTNHGVLRIDNCIKHLVPLHIFQKAPPSRDMIAICNFGGTHPHHAVR